MAAEAGEVMEVVSLDEKEMLHSLDQHPLEEEEDVPEVHKLRVKVRADSSYSEEKITELRESLKFMFRSPCEQLSLERSINSKLLIHLLQILLITGLMVGFHWERENFEHFLQANRIAFHHVFLKDWNVDLETPPYPPGTGDYAMYTQEELNNHMNFVLAQYYKFDELSLTSLRPHPNDSVTLEINYFTKLDLDVLQESYDVDSNKINITVELPKMNDQNCNETEALEGNCYRVQDHLKDGNHSIDLPRIVDMTMNFYLRGINVLIDDPTTNYIPLEVKCVTFWVKIKYDNSQNSGQFLVGLTTDLDMRFCENEEISHQNEKIEKGNRTFWIGMLTYDGVAIFLCLTALGIALVSIIHRLKAMKRIATLFWKHYGIKLSVSEKFEFITFWVFQHIFADSLIIAGTIIKIYLKIGHVAHNETFNNQKYYNAASIMLGYGNMSHWFGLIRYIAYFNKFYILILTIQKAIPNLLRFLFCGATMFFGYLFAGWIMLGPYNEKFKSLSSTTLSLFALLNGDEIYATMWATTYDDHPNDIWLFTWIYLYSYITIFIFAVLNLFIALIMDSYELLKNGTDSLKTLLEYFYRDTLIEVGRAKFIRQEVVRHKDARRVEREYGTISSLLSIFGRCRRENNNIGDGSADTRERKLRIPQDSEITTRVYIVV